MGPRDLASEPLAVLTANCAPMSPRPSGGEVTRCLRLGDMGDTEQKAAAGGEAAGRRSGSGEPPARLKAKYFIQEVTGAGWAGGRAGGRGAGRGGAAARGPECPPLSGSFRGERPCRGEARSEGALWAP